MTDPHRVPEHDLLREGAYGDRSCRPPYFVNSTPASARPGGTIHAQKVLLRPTAGCSRASSPPFRLLAGGSTPAAMESPKPGKRVIVLMTCLDHEDISQRVNDGIAPTPGGRPTSTPIEKKKNDSLSLLPSCASPQGVDLYGAGRAFGGGTRSTARWTSTCITPLRTIAQSTLLSVAPATGSVVVLTTRPRRSAWWAGNIQKRTPFHLATNGHRQPVSSSSRHPAPRSAGDLTQLPPQLNRRSSRSALEERVLPRPHLRLRVLLDLHPRAAPSTLKLLLASSPWRLQRQVRSGGGASPASSSGTKAIAKPAHGWVS